MTPTYVDVGPIHCATCRAILGRVGQLATAAPLDMRLKDAVRSCIVSNPSTGARYVDGEKLEQMAEPLRLDLSTGAPCDVLVTDRDAAGRRGVVSRLTLPATMTCRCGHENSIEIGRPDDRYVARPLR